MRASSPGRYLLLGGLLALLAAVLLSMRLLAEERAAGTQVLLFTSPLKESEIVIGKFIAALSFLTVLVLLSLLVLLAEYPAIGRAIQLKRTTLTALPAQPMCRWPDPEAHEDVPHPLCKWLDPKAREGVEKGLLHAKKALKKSWKPLILAAVTVSAIKWFQAVAIPALGTWAGPLAASAVAEIRSRVGRGVGAAKRAAEHAVAATKVVA